MTSIPIFDQMSLDHLHLRALLVSTESSWTLSPPLYLAEAGSSGFSKLLLLEKTGRFWACWNTPLQPQSTSVFCVFLVVVKKTWKTSIVIKEQRVCPGVFRLSWLSWLVFRVAAGLGWMSWGMLLFPQQSLKALCVFEPLKQRCRRERVQASPQIRN